MPGPRRQILNAVTQPGLKLLKPAARRRRISLLKSRPAQRHLRLRRILTVRRLSTFSIVNGNLIALLTYSCHLVKPRSRMPWLPAVTIGLFSLGVDWGDHDAERGNTKDPGRSLL